MKPKLPTPPFHDISDEDLEDHLTADCDLTIIELNVEVPEQQYTKEEMDMLNQFPSDHGQRSWTLDDGLDMDQPEQWYEAEEYDSVFSTKCNNPQHAKAKLIRLQLMSNATPVGPMFFASGRYCQRVKLK